MADGGVYLDDDGKFLIYGDKFDICGDCCASGGLQYTDDGRNVSRAEGSRLWADGYPASDGISTSTVGQTGGTGPDMNLDKDLSIGIKWRHHATPRHNLNLYLVANWTASTNGRWFVSFKNNTDDTSTNTGMQLNVQDETGTEYSTWIDVLPNDDEINTLVFRWNNTTYTASVSLNAANFTNLVCSDMSGVGNRTRTLGSYHANNFSCFGYFGCYVQVNDLCTQAEADALASLSPNSALPTFWQDANHYYDFDEATRFAGTFADGFAFFDQGTDASGWGINGNSNNTSLWLSSAVTITDSSPYDDTLTIEPSGRGVANTGGKRFASGGEGILGPQSSIQDFQANATYLAPTSIFFRAYIDNWFASGSSLGALFGVNQWGGSSWNNQGGFMVANVSGGNVTARFRQGVVNAWTTQVIDSGVSSGNSQFVTVVLKVDPTNLQAGISVNGSAFVTATLNEYLFKGVGVIGVYRNQIGYSADINATIGHCISMYRYASDQDALDYHNAVCDGTLPTFMQNPYYVKGILEFAEDATSDNAERRAYSIAGNMINYSQRSGQYGRADCGNYNSPTLETYCS